YANGVMRTVETTCASCRTFTWSAAALSLGLLLHSGQSAQATSTREEASEKFFASDPIPHLHIQVAETNLSKLRRNARVYVRATVKEGDRVYTDVGLHLKGAAGSFRPVDDSKPALTLNFDKFVEHQNFHGVDKLALNNSVQDPTYMTEALCSDLFL